MNSNFETEKAIIRCLFIDLLKTNVKYFDGKKLHIYSRTDNFLCVQETCGVSFFIYSNVHGLIGKSM